VSIEVYTETSYMKAVSGGEMAKQPTIYDVAKLAGVSPATVSRVLNSPSMVNPEKRKRIMEAIESLKFTPKADAVAKARQQFKRIGVIAPFFTEPSFMERLKGISSVLSSQHYELVVYAVQSTEELDGYVDMLVSSKRVDGLISLCMHLDQTTVNKLQSSDLPVCCVEKDLTGFDAVIVHNQEGGAMAAKALYEKGCHNPGFIGEASTRSYAAHSTEERLEGFSNFFKEKGIELEPSHYWLGENNNEISTQGILKMLDSPNRPDCIFASSDTLAIRTIKCAGQLGLTVPDDLAVIGFDDIEMAEYVDLTTINQGLEESGVLAAEMMLQRLKHPDQPVRKSLIALKLSERGSTAVQT